VTHPSPQPPEPWPDAPNYSPNFPPNFAGPLKPRAVQQDTAHHVAVVFASGGLIANTHAGAKCSTDGNFVQRDSNTTCDESTYPDFDQQFRVKTA